MGKDPRLNAERELNKADQLFDLAQYKKAAKLFNSAGTTFLKIHEFKIAKECFFNAAKSYIQKNKFSITLEALRNAGAAAIFLDDFSDAYQLFKTALKYPSYLRSERDVDFNYILFGALSYLCLFIEGKQDLGLGLMKQLRSKVDNAFFKENLLIKLIKNLTIAVRDKNKKYLDKVEEDFEYYSFREAEGLLAKKVLLLAKTHISLITNLKLDKEQYTTNDKINLELEINAKPLEEISNYRFFNYQISEIKITNIGLTLSDNFTPLKKPKLPLILKPGQEYGYKFEIRPNFQIDKSFIGPILLTCIIDEKFIFFLKTQTIKPNLVSPPASLTVSSKNLRTPLIGQSFPMEILIENKSEGEALDINVELEFPEKLKLMRGTLKKQVYSLKPNEHIKWELSLKPLEAADYEINMTIKYMDPDSNDLEQIEKISLSIKM